MPSQPIGYRTVHGVAAAGSLEDRDEEALEKVANIALPQEQHTRQKRDERRKPKYDQWRASNFRPGTHLNPVAAPAGGAVVPPQSLGEWFDSGFSEFVGSGSIFGNTPLPEGYEAVIGDTGMPLVFHRANNVQVWPIRLHLGTVQDARDSVTLYHYLGPKAMRGIAGLLTRGASALDIFDAIERDARSARRSKLSPPEPDPTEALADEVADAHVGGFTTFGFGSPSPAGFGSSGRARSGSGGGFAATVLEPAKFAQAQDLLFDRVGEEHWPPARWLDEAVERCVAIRVPVHVLSFEDIETRPDRFLVLGPRLRPFLEASKVVGAKAKTQCFAAVGDVQEAGRRMHLDRRQKNQEALMSEAGQKRRSCCLCLRRSGGQGAEVWTVPERRFDLARLREGAEQEAKRPHGSLELAPR